MSRSGDNEERNRGIEREEGGEKRKEERRGRRGEEGERERE